MNVETTGKLAGRYRAKVENPVDPQKRERLMVSVPDVLGDDPCIWAESTSGIGAHALPLKGDWVWVEFEGGDINYATWSGTWRSRSEDLPEPARSAPPAYPPVVLETRSEHHRLVLSDQPGEKGGILLRHSSGASITINSNGITLDNGKGAKITLNGKTVAINDDGLKVT
ncbi:phage baseplate assembly protein V [Actinoplanes sp. CA-030573]|uniref:phage baseplate assembly protein V n=1 Tax=Actinoplanes sp. CA-030573 TaxID=3239898 RepID=UPI003D8CD609